MRSRILGSIGVGLLVFSCSVGLARTAHAEPTDAQINAVLAEAEPKEREASQAASRGELERAGEIEEANAKYQGTVVFPRVTKQEATLGVVALASSGECWLRSANYYTKAQKLGRAADALDRAIATAEALGKLSPRQAELPSLKRQAAELRSKAGGTPSKPSAAPAVRAPVAESPLEAVQRGVKLSSSKPSEAIAIFDANFPKLDAAGTSTAAVAEANLSAARVYNGAEMPAKAEPRLARALAIREATSGKNDASLIDVLAAYGSHYLGDEPERAAPYYMRAYDIAQASSRKHVPVTIMNLALVLRKRKDFREAILLVERARAILDEAPPAIEGVFSRMSNSLMLASLYEEVDQFEKAEPLYEETRALLEPYYRQAPELLAPFWASYQVAVAQHWRKRANFPKAEQHAKTALELVSQLYPKESLAFANAECNLGEIYWAAGDLDRSLGPIGHCFDLREKAISGVLASGSEEQKRAYLSGYLIAYEKTMTAQIRANNSNTRLNQLAMTQVLRTKGRVLDAVTGESQAIRRNADDATRSLLDQLATVRTTLAGISTNGSEKDRIKQLEEESRRLEAQLSEKSASFRRATKEVSIATVRSAIPNDAALVEIVAFRPLDPLYRLLSDAEPERYIAYVLHADGSLVAVDLGPSAGINETAARLRTAVSDPTADPIAPAKRLYEQVLAPLEPHLKGKKHLIVSPDGALNTVPFAAMRKNDSYLVDEYAFTYVTSGRELLRWSDTVGDTKGVIVIANPDFAMNGERAAATSLFSRVKFPPLPGTDTEAKALKGLFPSASTFTGKDASESRLKELRHPRVLHLATHGFFLDTTKSAAKSTRALELDDAAQTEVAEAQSPLLRSGLALAGASSLDGSRQEDGILTALEASSLDLSGTKLVVLSACQTAQGEAKNGEGVYGLRRALAQAGAETLVMSLWSVDDEATSFLMRGYYKRLKSGRGRSEALRDVQLEMARSKGVHHPYYWAAFIPSGNPSRMTLVDEAYSPGGTPAAPPPPPKDQPSRPRRTDDDDDNFSVTPQSMGAFGVHYASTTDLRGQRDRTAILASFGMTTPVISRFMGTGRVGIHDALTGSIYVGGRSSTAVRYSGPEDKEGSLAYGLRGGYELAPGVRFRPISVHVGALVEYNSYGIGDMRTYGTTLPLLGMINLHTGLPIGLRGTYGKWIVDQEALSGAISFFFKSFDLRVGVEQLKMDTTVGLDSEEARAAVGRRTSTIGTISFGGTL